MSILGRKLRLIFTLTAKIHGLFCPEKQITSKATGSCVPSSMGKLPWPCLVKYTEHETQVPSHSCLCLLWHLPTLVTHWRSDSSLIRADQMSSNPEGAKGPGSVFLSEGKKWSSLGPIVGTFRAADGPAVGGTGAGSDGQPFGQPVARKRVYFAVSLGIFHDKSSSPNPCEIHAIYHGCKFCCCSLLRDCWVLRARDTARSVLGKRFRRSVHGFWGIVDVLHRYEG